MDDRALRILNKIRNAQSSWDTTKLQDPTQMPGAQAGQPAPTGLGGDVSPEALAGVLKPTMSPELDASQPLEQGIPPPSGTQSGEMSKLDAILKRRNTSKSNFLGGSNGLN
jgi:hypothetical protein